MDKYKLKFDLNLCEKLDRFVLSACQKQNYGNKGDWFGNFRGGIYGFYAKIYGVNNHYRDLHKWQYKIRSPMEYEYHIASLFFNMDSSLECFIYALNAFGFGVLRKHFFDITNDKHLKKINPSNLIGRKDTRSNRGPYLGYNIIFPTLQKFWQKNRKLISTIIEQHDVSKHRKTIMKGGKARLDTPDGFYEKLGVENKPNLHFYFWPMESIYLRNNPKMAHVSRTSVNQSKKICLEDVVIEYCHFINKTLSIANQDSENNVQLNERVNP